MSTVLERPRTDLSRTTRPRTTRPRTTRPRADLRAASEPTDLLARYLQALDRFGDPEPQRRDLPPGADVRTCACCGDTTLFRLDPEGGWAFCTTCSRAA